MATHTAEAKPSTSTKDNAPTSQGTHGGEVYRLARKLGVEPDDILDFSSNANSLCDDLTRTILGRIAYPYRHYPDTWCSVLREKLAVHEEVSPHSILVGNGSSENIFLTIQQIRPRHVALVAPIFSEYVRACEAFDIPYTLITCHPENNFACSGQELKALSQSDADMVIICSPNNPAGITYTNIEQILSTLRAQTVLVDNTYSEFLWGLPEYDTNRYTMYRHMVPHDTEVITVQSFTKFFYCTGVRLGYSVSSPRMTERLAQGKVPWTVSAFAEQAGVEFMNSMGEYRTRLEALRAERTRFSNALAKTGAFDPDMLCSGVNFISGRLRNADKAADVYSHLLDQGILVRLCDNIPGMPSGFLRMQVREQQAWEKLILALQPVQ